MKKIIKMFNFESKSKFLGKGLIITAVVFMTSVASPVSADTNWTLQGNNIFNSNTGNVGIGTTTPTARLDVGGTGNIILNTSSGVISLKGRPNGRAMVAVGGVGDYVFNSSANGATESAALHIRPVSISNTSGTGNIHGVYIAGISLQPAGASPWGTSLTIEAPNKGGTGTFTNMASLYIPGTPIGGTNNYTLYADGKTILAATIGNVGIGTITPGAKLDVAGNIKLSGNIISDGDICIGTCQ